MKKRFLLLVTLIHLIPVLLQATLTPVQLIEGAKPIYPPALKEQAEQGTAKVRMVVDETGTVIEADVESATHPEFGEAAVVAVKQWKFRPARDETGPVSQTVVVPIQFTLSFEEKINSAMGRDVYVNLDQLTDKVYHAKRDLNQKFKPLGNNIWRGIYPKELKGSGTTEKVRVDYVITPEGRAVNPDIKNIKNKEFFVPAIIKVAQYQFEPIMVDGKAVYVQEFFTVNFTEAPSGNQKKK